MKSVKLAVLIVAAMLPGYLYAETVSIDAGRGEVLVHVPDDYVAGTALPLVILLHGLGADGNRQENGGTLDLLGILADGMKFAPNVNDFQFHLALPNGRIQGILQPHLHWNATDACCRFGAPEEDDGAYILSLIDAIAEDAHFATLPSAVYLVGHSNGGFLAHQVACRFSDRITAIVSFAGTTFLDPDDCRNVGTNQLVHILHIHGDSDFIVSYNGGNSLGIIPAPAYFPGALKTIENWAYTMKDSGDCDQTALPTTVLENMPLIAGNVDVDVFKYECSHPNASVTHWKLKEVGHLPAFSDDFSRTILRYLYELE